MQPTIFHVTHWKAGSQWIRAVLEEAAGTRIVPQKPGQDHVFRDPIVPGGVYTPVYAAVDQLRGVTPPGLDHRTFVVVRDPRDTLVSWYHSLRYSHGDDWECVPELRKMLNEVDPVDGMAILMRGEMYDVVSIQMTWLQAGARMFRYEDLWQDEVAGFREILKYCEIDVSEDRLGEIVGKNSFERLSGRKRGVTDVQAHLRKGEPGDWKNHFPPQLTSMFRTLFGDATVRLGYADRGDHPW